MPLGVIIKIITLLPIDDRKNLRRTSKQIKHVADLHNLWLNQILNKSNDKLIEELKNIQDHDIEQLDRIIQNRLNVHDTYGQPNDEFLIEELENDRNKLYETQNLINNEKQRRLKKSSSKGGNKKSYIDLPIEIYIKILLNIDQNQIFNDDLKLVSKKYKEMIDEYVKTLNILINEPDLSIFRRKVEKMSLTKNELNNLQNFISYDMPSHSYAAAQRLEDHIDPDFNKYYDRIAKLGIIDDIIKSYSSVSDSSEENSD